MRLAGVLGVALALLGCGGASTTPVGVDGEGGSPPDAIDGVAPPSPTGHGRGRAPTPGETAAIRRLVRTAERIRRLHFVRAVPVRILDAATIRASLAEDMDEHELHELHDAEVLYGALGLLPAGTDLRALMLTVLGEQVVGFYDTHAKELVVRDDVMADLAREHAGLALDETGMVIVHELVHALQDQDLGIGALYDAREDLPSDSGDSFRSLVEGDATLAMIGYIAEQAARQAGGDPSRALELLTSRHDVLERVVTEATPPSGDELSRAPPIVRESLLSAYMDGMLFCASVHARGGFAALDDVYRRPPASTEQILHPEKYVANEAPETVDVPELAGWTRGPGDVLGELALRVYFQQAADTAIARSAAAGWSGDRAQVLVDPHGVTGVAWLTRWDDEHEATEAEAAALRVAALGDAESRSHQLVVRSGRDVLVVRGVDPAEQDAVRRALLRP